MSASVLCEVAALLDELECRSYSLSATDAAYWAARRSEEVRDGRPNIRLTIIGRTMFEAVCTAVGVTPKERMTNPGQRGWFAEADSSTRRLLIEGVSFQHHDDWEVRS